MIEDKNEDLPREGLLILFDKNKNRTIFQKILVLLFNKTIFSSLILFIVAVSFYCAIYYYFNYLNPVFALVTGSILTILLIIIREKFNLINNRNNFFLLFTNELATNWNSLRNNYRTLKSELNRLNDDNFIISIIYFIQLDICRLILLNFPKKSMDMDLMNINLYIKDSNEINQLIQNRKDIQRHRFINDKQFRSALKVYDNQIIGKTENALDHILRLLEFNGRLIKIDDSELNNLINEKNLDEFSKLNRLDKEKIRDNIKEARERNIKTLIIFDSKI